MKKAMKKAIASGLLITTIASTTNEVQACDAAAVMETAKEASMACPYIAPVVITGAAIITGVTTVIGIKNKNKETDDYIYQSLQHLPDSWRPNSDHGTPEYHPFGHGGAHAHEYRGTKRLRGRELTDEEYQRYIKDFDSKAADKMRVKYIPDNK